MQRAIERTGVCYKDSRGIIAATFQDSGSREARIAAQLAAVDCGGIPDGEVVRVQLVEVDSPVSDWVAESVRLRQKNLELQHALEEAVEHLRTLAGEHDCGCDHLGGLVTARVLTDASLALSSQ